MPNISPNLPTRIAYGYIKSVTGQSVVDGLSSVGAVRITNDRIYFDRTPDGHQAGDLYFIRFKQEASVNPNDVQSHPSNIGSYFCDTEFGAYVSSGTATSYDEEVESFDSTSVIGRKIKFYISDSAEVPVWAQGITVVANKLYYYAGNYYSPVGVGTTGSQPPTHTSGIRSDGNILWRYMHSGYAYATVISVTDSSHLVAKVDGRLPILDTSLNSYEWDNYQWSIWGYNGVYPDQVFTFSGRLGYVINTDGYGSWLHMSKSDNYEDFSVEDFGATTDICGINVVLSAHTDNRINWVMSGYRLYMGSYSGEYNIKGDSSTGVITPSSLSVLGVSSMGGDRVEPLKYNELNLFVGYTGKELFSLHYDYSSDDYVPEHVSYVAESVFEPGIKRMTLLKDGSNAGFCRAADNTMFAMYYQEELKVLSAFRNNVGGSVIDIAASQSAGDSCVFYVLNNGDKYYLEYIDSVDQDYMLSAKRVFAETGNVASTITDTQYVNKEIYIKDLNTGDYQKTTVSSTGVITNPYTTNALVYGIPMPCVLHFNPAFGEKLEGLMQKSVRFSLRLLDSGPFSYGSSNDFDRYYQYQNKDFPDDKRMTGDVSLPSSFGYMQGQNTVDGMYPNDTGTALNLFTDAPLPFNLLMISELYV